MMFLVRIPWVAALAALLVLAGAQSAPVQAQTQAQPKDQGAQQGSPVSFKTAVVNLDKIRHEAAMFKTFREKLKQHVESIRAREKAEREEIDKASQEFSRKRTIMAPEAYSEERAKFEKRVAEFQKRGQARQETLNRIQAEGLAQAQKIVEKALVDFAVQHRVAMVFRADMLAFYHPSLDVSDLILKALDESKPTIEVPALEK